MYIQKIMYCKKCHTNTGQIIYSESTDVLECKCVICNTINEFDIKSRTFNNNERFGQEFWCRTETKYTSVLPIKDDFMRQQYICRSCNKPTFNLDFWYYLK